MLMKPATKNQLLEEILTFMNLGLAGGSIQDYFRLEDLLKGLMGLRKAVILMIMVYYSGNTQIKIIKRKRHMGWSPGETRCKLPGVLSQCSGTSALRSSAVILWQHLSTGKLSRTLVSRIFIGAQSHRLAAFLSGRIFQGFRVHFLGTDQGPVLNEEGLSWKCEVLEQLRPAQQVSCSET